MFAIRNLKTTVLPYKRDFFLLELLILLIFGKITLEGEVLELLLLLFLKHLQLSQFLFPAPNKNAGQ